MAIPSRPNLLSVDDLYFSALSNEDEIFPTSDEKYAEQLQLQEALMSSVISSANGLSRIEESGSKKLKSVQGEAPESSNGLSTMEESPSKKRKSIQGEAPESSNGLSKMEKRPSKKRKLVQREAAKSSQNFCEICMEGKPTGEMFMNKTCSHSYCADCISKHVAAKIQQNINKVNRPELKCKGVLEPDLCRSIVPREVFDRWVDALCESLILGSQKFYCPFKDCSAMLVDEGEVVTESRVPELP